MKLSRSAIACLLALCVGGCGEEPVEAEVTATAESICGEIDASHGTALLPPAPCLSVTVEGTGYFVFHGACQVVDGAAHYPQYFGKQLNLRLDSAGYLTHDEGLRVQGYNADAYGNLQYPLGDIQITHSYTVPSDASQSVSVVGPLAPNTAEERIYPHPSTKISFGTGGSLPPQSSMDYLAAGFDITTLTAQVGGTALASYHYTQNVTLFDNAISETGPRAHSATLYFTQTATHNWQWHAVVAASTLEPTSLNIVNSDVVLGENGAVTSNATVAIVATGQLIFNADGSLANGSPEERAALAQNTVLNNFAFLNTLDIQTITFDFVNSYLSEGSGAFGLTPTADGSLGFQPSDPEGTSHAWTSANVADPNAVSHTVNIFFNESAPGTWQWHALADGAEVVDPEDESQTRAGENVVLADGIVTFDSNGRLLTESQTDRTFHFVGTDGTHIITFEFGDNITPTSEGGDGGDGSTGLRQTGTESAVTATAHHEETSRILESITVDASGIITGAFTYTGQTRTLAGLALASFAAEEALTPEADDEALFTATAESGEAAPGQAGADGRGTLTSESLGPACIE